VDDGATEEAGEQECCRSGSRQRNGRGDYKNDNHPSERRGVEKVAILAADETPEQAEAHGDGEQGKAAQ